MGNAAAVQKAHDEHAQELNLRHGSAKHSRNIDRALEKEKTDNQNKFKILLLGGSESGKTTVFKQMRILHLNGFTKEDIEQYRQYIHNNVLDSLHQLIEAIKILQLAPEMVIEEDIQQFIDFRAQVHELEEWKISKPMSKMMERIWRSKSIQKAYEKRFTFNLLDSAKYFLDSLSRICEDDYQPTQQDILHCRYRTTGVSEINFIYQKIGFMMVDVGGQRTERRKWMHCFDNVDMVLFIIAISDYDMRDPEDESQNRMLQNFEIFKTIVQSHFFVHCSVVLFMNKYDIFQEKLARSSLRVCYPDYRGDNSVEDATKHIQMHFRRCITDRHKYFVFETTATDTRQIDYVFGSAVSHIVSENLKSTGLHE